MAFGGKISSAATSIFYFDVPPQTAAYFKPGAHVVVCSTGDNIRVKSFLASLNINGITRTRLAIQFTDAVAGTAYALNTTTSVRARSLMSK